MNSMSHDFDAVGEDGKLIVPSEVQEALRVLLRWTGEARTVKVCWIHPHALAARGANIAKATPKTPAYICRGRLKKSAAMTPSFC